MKIPPKNITLKDGLNLVLRSPEPSDAENILTHLRITHTESYQNLNQTVEYWKQMAIKDEEKILAEFESSPFKFMLAAFHHETIVGGLGFFGNPGQFANRNGSLGMSIQNAYSGLGLGTELLQYALTNAQNLNFHRVDLKVRTYNSAGISLYEKCGFKKTGHYREIAFIDGKYVDEYSYELIFLE